MTFIIGRVLDSSQNVIGYRLLHYETMQTKELSINSVVQNFRKLDIKNYHLRHKELHENGGEEQNYPIVMQESLEVLNNKIIILFKTVNNTYAVTDCTGRVREVTFKQLKDCDKKLVANILSFKEFKIKRCTQEESKSSTIDKKSHTVGENGGKQWGIFEDTSLVKNLLGGISSLVKPILRSNTVGENGDIVELQKARQLIEEQLTRTIPIPSESPADTIDSANESIDKSNTPVEPVEPLKSETDTVVDTETTAENAENDENNESQQSETEDKQYQPYVILTTTDEDRIIATGIKPSDYDQSIEIPFGVTHIEDGAFRDSKITECKIPETVIYMGEAAFANSNVEVVQLPASLKAIPHDCFYKSNLKVINLENITSVGNRSFSYCNIEEVHLKSGVAQIGIETFSDCRNLAVFEHAGTIRKIRARAFAGCVALDNFEFTGITEIEEQAFFNVSLKSVTINGDITYVKSYTFQSDELETVEILDGCYKLADYCCASKGPITYTVPKSVSNIGVNVFNKKDTVRCYHHSIAESSAKLADCNIEYLDDSTQMSRSVLKASMVGADIKELIENMIKDAYNSDDVDYEYEIDESCKTLSTELTPEQLSFLGLESLDVPSGYEEKPKFKVILEHYAKCCELSGIGLSSKMFKVKDTVSVISKTIYTDGISRVYEFIYSDHKYESKKSKCIVAMTGNTVRYCCLNNKMTDLYCRTSYSKDLSKLLNMLVPGDTIGYDCTIAGKRYEQIASKGNIKNKNNELISMNIYQALFNCSIAIKLDRNHLALILPVNGKILKCASLGKAVWANENDESYKAKYCVIEDIQDLKGNTIIDYETRTPSRDDKLFNEIKAMSNDELDARIRAYSIVGEAKLSPYYSFRNYCIQHGIDSIDKLDLKGLGLLLAFPIVEERSMEWLDKYSGKTIVDAAKSVIQLSDGTSIHQYKTVKRVAMRNKLLTGGDRTIYVYEVFSKYGNRIKVMSGMFDMDELYKIGISMSNIDTTKSSKIYKNESEFDVVKLDDMILVAAAFVNTHEKDEGKKVFNYMWLAVYKPNGLYYITFVSKSKGIAIPLVQIGEFDVVLDYIDCANTSSASGYSTLMSTGLYVLNNYNMSRSAFRGSAISYSKRTYSVHHNELLKARRLAIEGNTNIAEYMATNVPPVVCHMFGVNNYGDGIYEMPVYTAIEEQVDTGKQVEQADPRRVDTSEQVDTGKQTNVYHEGFDESEDFETDEHVSVNPVDTVGQSDTDEYEDLEPDDSMFDLSDEDIDALLDGD